MSRDFYAGELREAGYSPPSDEWTAEWNSDEWRQEVMLGLERVFHYWTHKSKDNDPTQRGRFADLWESEADRVRGAAYTEVFVAWPAYKSTHERAEDIYRDQPWRSVHDALFHGLRYLNRHLGRALQEQQEVESLEELLEWADTVPANAPARLGQQRDEVLDAHAPWSPSKGTRLLFRLKRRALHRLSREHREAVRLFEKSTRMRTNSVARAMHLPVEEVELLLKEALVAVEDEAYRADRTGNNVRAWRR